jgi:predicted ATPase/class 3 adenylate cyclase
LFTDIEGSTALLKGLGDRAYAEALSEHHGMIRAALASHGGKEISTQGDGFFAVFSSASGCASGAIEMQRAFATHAWPAGTQVRVRMGVHCGEASETSTTGLVGFGIHRAARVAAVAHGGQVLLSEAAASVVRDSLPAGATLRDLGSHRLKDLGRPEQIFQLEAEGLVAEFPPLRSLDNPELPNNLPAQSASFVGRQREVVEVRDLVSSGRLVTLTGAGGSGKTRLALQVAAELLDGSGDGVWLVELAPVASPEGVATAIAGTLGAVSEPGRLVLETLLDALAPQNILIILDNCEHLVDSCAKVADAILRRCSHVHLITTSREPLGINGETIYRVPSLSLPRADEDEGPATGASDAVALFVDRARAQGADLILSSETLPLVVSICRRLDGMPLAIELAAARLRSLSLANLHGRLDQRFRLLTGGSRSAMPRQQTLRATVEWSYSLLNEPEQSVLRRLSVFVEGFDLDAAEAVCSLGDIDEFEVTDLLGSLVDKSLVVAEPGESGTVRYRLLETIRQFSAERLVERDEHEAAAVSTAHCSYFLSLARQGEPYLTGPRQGRWLARLGTEQANLRRAIEHAVAEPDGTARALGFAVALNRYWWVRARREEAAGLLSGVLERPEAQAEPQLLCAALLMTGAFIGSVGPEWAQRNLEKAVEIARSLGDERVLANSLGMLGAVLYFAGKAEVGLPYGEEALARARQLGDDVVLGESLLLYLLNRQALDPATTGELYAEALACTRRSGDRFIGYVLRNNAGCMALDLSDVPAARAHLDQARQIAREIGSDAYHVDLNLGWVSREEGDSQTAASLFRAALRMARRHGDRSGTAYVWLGLACTALDQGDWRRGAVLLGHAQAYRDLSGTPWLRPEVRYRQLSMDLARAELGDQEFERAFAEGKDMPPGEAADLALG